MTPNFKKKKTTEVSVTQDYLQYPQNSHQDSNSGSFINEQNNPHHGESRFFNEGSSISDIASESMHNPENKRTEESMFQSAIMGLNNESSIHTPGQQAQRQTSAMASQASFSSQPSSEEEHISFSFEARAP